MDFFIILGLFLFFHFIFYSLDIACFLDDKLFYGPLCPAVEIEVKETYVVLLRFSRFLNIVE